VHVRAKHAEKAPAAHALAKRTDKASAVRQHAKHADKASARHEHPAALAKRHGQPARSASSPTKPARLQLALLKQLARRDGDHRTLAMLAGHSNLNGLSTKQRRKLAKAQAALMAYQAHLQRQAAAVEAQKRHAQIVAQERAEAIVRARDEYKEHVDRLASVNRRLELFNDHVLPVLQWDTYECNVPLRVITVDLTNSGVRVKALLAQAGIGSSEPFTHMIERTQPDVAVTGTFFSLDNKKPVGDIVINGNLAYFGGMGTALCITPDNHADMVTVPWGHHYDWSKYDCVVACGPRLLEDGAITLDPSAERFHDKHMLAPNSRLAVGITADNHLIFVMTRDTIYLGRLAKVMKALGCQQAMNLDAGTSTGFYCNGDLMARPGRWLTNAILVYTGQRTSASNPPTNPAPASQPE
jgi:hypothetical protein